MEIEEKKVTTKKGDEFILRTPVKEDAEEILQFRRDIAGETKYLIRYPYEIENSVEKEEEIIKNYSKAEHIGMIAVFDGKKIIGLSSISPIGLSFKTRHRACMEISVRKAYWNLGLGSMLLDQIVYMAENIGYERLELSVFADNARALRLYKKKGFIDCGQIPQAFKTMDGHYHDEVLMTKNLWKKNGKY